MLDNHCLCSVRFRKPSARPATPRLDHRPLGS